MVSGAWNKIVQEKRSGTPVMALRRVSEMAFQNENTLLACLLIETQEQPQCRQTTGLRNCLEEENGREKGKAMPSHWNGNQTNICSFREGSLVSGNTLNTQKEGKESLAFLSNSRRCTELHSYDPVSCCAMDSILEREGVSSED